MTSIRLRPHPVAAAIVLLSLLVHGLQASALGLYWDDALQLLQPLQAVGHDPLAFLLADTGPSLRSERPLAYLAFGITRLAFLYGVAPVHWTLVALLAANAVAIAAVARRLVNDDWFAFAAAAVFLCYPLAPLQPLWAATVHYQVACLLALLCIVCIDREMTGPAARRGAWIVAGIGAYAASLLTHEGFALVPPAFVAVRWLCAPAGGRRRIGARLVPLAGVLALFALWRVALLPAYGLQLYPMRWERLAVGAVLPKLWQGVLAAWLPWRSAVNYVLRSQAGQPWLLAAAAAALAGVVSVALLRRATPGNVTGARPWWCAFASGTAMLVAGAMSFAASPIAIEYAFGLSYGSRGNFLVLPGIAIALPALLAGLAELLARPWGRLATTISQVGLSVAVTGIVFAGSLLHVTVKREFVREWEGHKSRLATLRALAPRIADSSLVIILDDRDRRAPYADHYEMSVYLLALYDNWSLLGNTTRHLRFYEDGVESTYHGTPGEWFAPGDRGILAGATLQPVGRIAYDRVLLFRNDGGRLRPAADTVFATEDGGNVLVKSNLGRVGEGPPPSTRTWRHLTR